MRNPNIVLFSSGVTENNGMLDTVSHLLAERGYHCMYWRDLFAGAHDMNNIALLPTLIKKIPSFDFAVLICEGHDRTFIYRDGVEEEVNTMRDNVLFEIGLCVMALGLPRTILLTNGAVRIPDDLTGVGNDLAVKRIIYDAEDPSTFHSAAEATGNYIYDQTYDLAPSVAEMDRFIQENRHTTSPVVVGAAAGTACGYVSNFIFRILECFEQGLILEDSQELQYIPSDRLKIHIMIPEDYESDTELRAKTALSRLHQGQVPYARMRPVSFYYERIGDELHIYDYPTTIVTSYHVSQIILNMEADEDHDNLAQQRFVNKELDLFEGTLLQLLCEQYVRDTVESFYSQEPSEMQEERIQKLCSMLPQISVERL